MPVVGMKQSLFGGRQYITVSLLWCTPLGSLPSSLRPPSRCLTGADWQPFVWLLIWGEMCILALLCQYVCACVHVGVEYYVYRICAVISELLFQTLNQPPGATHTHTHRRRDSTCQSAWDQSLSVCVRHNGNETQWGRRLVTIHPLCLSFHWLIAQITNACLSHYK